MYFPIINYHEIFADEVNNEKHAIHIDEFGRQMEYLSKNSFNTLNLSDLFNIKIDSTKNYIALSFDDGHLSDYKYVFPILKKYNFIGNFFITTGWIGKEGYMNWADIIEMSNSGMSIQSHSVTHRFLPDLSDSELRAELLDSKNMLEESIKSSVDFISIPSGFVTKRVIQMAEEEGYRGVCTSMPGLNRIGKIQIFVLDRITITRDTDFDIYKRITRGDTKSIQSMRNKSKIKASIRRLIGNKLYYKLWSIFYKEV